MLPVGAPRAGSDLRPQPRNPLAEKLMERFQRNQDSQENLQKEGWWGSSKCCRSNLRGRQALQQVARWCVYVWVVVVVVGGARAGGRRGGGGAGVSGGAGKWEKARKKGDMAALSIAAS